MKTVVKEVAKGEAKKVTKEVKVIGSTKKVGKKVVKKSTYKVNVLANNKAVKDFEGTISGVRTRLLNAPDVSNDVKKLLRDSKKDESIFNELKRSRVTKSGKFNTFYTLQKINRMLN